MGLFTRFRRYCNSKWLYLRLFLFGSGIIAICGTLFLTIELELGGDALSKEMCSGNFGNQAGGHSVVKGSQIPRFVSCGDGTIMKAVRVHKQPRKKGDYTEPEFYRTVFESSPKQPYWYQLQELIPRYLGHRTTEIVLPSKKRGNSSKRKQVVLLHLEDLTHKFHRANVLDVKIGLDWVGESNSKEENNERHREKIGFWPKGIRTYKEDTGTYESHDEFYFDKNMDEKQLISQVVRPFFTSDVLDFRQDVIRQVLVKLEAIETFFKSQKILKFISSSILILYEADSRKVQYESDCKECVANSTCTECVAKSNLVDVKMIDFVHIFDSDKKDQTYLHGLRSLIKNLEKLVQKPEKSVIKKKSPDAHLKSTNSSRNL